VRLLPGDFVFQKQARKMLAHQKYQGGLLLRRPPAVNGAVLG
jgi:hypothetical protein